MSTIELHEADCMKWMQENSDRRFQLSFFSPPYATKTERYPGSRKKMKWREWADWMCGICIHCCRLTDGFVCVVSNNPVVDAECLPANERLILNMANMGFGIERRVIWSKNQAPSRHQGKYQWFSNAYEEILCFYHKVKGRPTIWNWEAIAEPPKYTNGGNFRQRDSRGVRRQGGEYPKTKLARPKDVLRVTVGGGHMGSDLAHEQEAAFPEKLVEPFVLALTNPGDTVFDPFCGSGTSLAVANRLGRNAVGIDIRESQISLSKRRLGIK